MGKSVQPCYDMIRVTYIHIPIELRIIRVVMGGGWSEVLAQAPNALRKSWV